MECVRVHGLSDAAAQHCGCRRRHARSPFSPQSTRVRHGCGLRRPWITLALSLAYVMLGCAWFVFNAARLPKPPVIQRMLGIAVGSKLVQCVLQMVYLRILQLSGDVLKSISNMYASATCVIEAGEHL